MFYLYDFKQDQRNSLYAAEQIQVFENVMIINDQETNFQNWLKIFKSNKKCADLMTILRNKTEENTKV